MQEYPWFLALNIYSRGSNMNSVRLHSTFLTARNTYGYHDTHHCGIVAFDGMKVSNMKSVEYVYILHFYLQFYDVYYDELL